ncbi:transcription factor/nuclear export subunit protein 2-domain-containing protein [Limtongia smithiae]|uniref:transcription factor/nuclear export subunit protein 2-domain-containing protein n=1 Tax=Limtongia smithiae TaxID=1125753 RepID=UPI0034CDA74D
MNEASADGLLPPKPDAGVSVAFASLSPMPDITTTSTAVASPDTPAATVPMSEDAPAGLSIKDLTSTSWLIVDDSLVEALKAGDIAQGTNILDNLIAENDINRIMVCCSELISCVMINRIAVDNVAAVFNHFLTVEQSSSACFESLLIDTLSIFDYSPAFNSLIHSLNIKSSLFQLRLEPSVLTPTDYNIPNFERRIVRANTAALYKQKRFNLLREESEGYAKLIVEIHSAAYAPNNTSIIDDTINNIISIVGYFDLDPNRALDIFLDIFSMHIVAHCQFFLAVLKRSPWWPPVPAVANSIEDLAIGGSSHAAALLGFKVLAYAKQAESVPENLMMTIAVLIKEQFICLADIYPYLSPTDDDLNEEKQRWITNLESAASVATASALALAAPLDDEMPGSSSFSSGETKQQTEEQKREEEEQENAKRAALLQKPQLLAALLTVGAVWPAQFILTKFPFLPGPFTDIADTINVLMSHALSSFYQSLVSPVSLFGQSDNVKKIPSDNARTFLLVTPKPIASRRVLNHLKRSERADTTYRVFYDSWASGITPIESIEDLMLYSDIFLKFNGPQLSRDKTLFTRLCRVVTHFLDQLKPDVKMQYNKTFWLQYFRTYLLPAISLIEHNPGVMDVVAKLLFHYDYETRYSVYGEWHSGLMKRIPELRVAASVTAKETKNILKRLSQSTALEMQRQLAVISYSDPITCLVALVSQVESYDNFGDNVANAIKYFNRLGWDAVPFAIMMQLLSGRSTIQADGLTERKWLQSLASFTGTLCTQYEYMDPVPLLQYIQRRLHDSNTSDIIILQEIIEGMSGIVKLSTLTEAQVEGLSCGPRIRSEMFRQIGDTRMIKQKSAARLLSCLASLNIVSELFVLLAQQLQMCVFNVPDYQAHTKILGTRYDDMSVILSQYIEFLNYSLLESGEFTRFDGAVLDVVTLIDEFSVDPMIAFSLWRLRLGNEVRVHDQVNWSNRETSTAAMRKSVSAAPATVGVPREESNAVISEIVEGSVEPPKEQSPETAEQSIEQPQEERLGAAKPIQASQDERSDIVTGQPAEAGAAESKDTAVEIEMTDAAEPDAAATSETEKPDDKDIEMTDSEPTTEEAENPREIAQKAESADAEMTDAANESSKKEMSNPEFTITAECNAKSEVTDTDAVWHPVLRKIVHDLSFVAHPGIWDYVSKGLFVTFFQLSVYDIYYPIKRYQDELEKLRKEIRALESDIDDSRKVTTASMRESRETLVRQHSQLQADNGAHMGHFERTRHRLLIEKDQWFAYSVASRAAINSFSSDDQRKKQESAIQVRQITEFVMRCVIPRALFSAADAVFCVKFLKQLHMLATPHFITVAAVDDIFNAEKFFRRLVSCTPSEVENLGRFTCELLKDLSRWHTSEAIYYKEGLGRVVENGVISYLPGMRLSLDRMIFPNDDLEEEAKDSHMLEYGRFKKIVFKWHTLLKQSVIDCLDSTDYIYRRNAIILLKNIVSVFPVVSSIGKSILDKISQISKTEEREDLKLSATALHSLLKRQSNHWVEPSVFRYTERELKATREEQASKAEAEASAAAEAEAAAKAAEAAAKAIAQAALAKKQAAMEEEAEAARAAAEVEAAAAAAKAEAEAEAAPNQETAEPPADSSEQPEGPSKSALNPAAEPFVQGSTTEQHTEQSWDTDAQPEHTTPVAAETDKGMESVVLKVVMREDSRIKTEEDSYNQQVQSSRAEISPSYQSESSRGRDTAIAGTPLSSMPARDNMRGPPPSGPQRQGSSGGQSSMRDIYRQLNPRFESATMEERRNNTENSNFTAPAQSRASSSMNWRETDTSRRFSNGTRTPSGPQDYNKGGASQGWGSNDRQGQKTPNSSSQWSTDRAPSNPATSWGSHDKVSSGSVNSWGNNDRPSPAGPATPKWGSNDRPQSQPPLSRATPAQDSFRQPPPMESNGRYSNGSGGNLTNQYQTPTQPTQPRTLSLAARIGGSGVGRAGSSSSQNNSDNDMRPDDGRRRNGSDLGRNSSVPATASSNPVPAVDYERERERSNLERRTNYERERERERERNGSSKDYVDDKDRRGGSSSAIASSSSNSARNNGDSSSSHSRHRSEREHREHRTSSSSHRDRDSPAAGPIAGGSGAAGSGSSSSSRRERDRSLRTRERERERERPRSGAGNENAGGGSNEGGSSGRRSSSRDRRRERGGSSRKHDRSEDLSGRVDDKRRRTDL